MENTWPQSVHSSRIPGALEADKSIANCNSRSQGKKVSEGIRTLAFHNVSFFKILVRISKFRTDVQIFYWLIVSQKFQTSLNTLKLFKGKREIIFTHFRKFVLNFLQILNLYDRNQILENLLCELTAGVTESLLFVSRYSHISTT